MFCGVEDANISIQILSDKLTTWKEFMAKAPAFADLK